MGDKDGIEPCAPTQGREELSMPSIYRSNRRIRTRMYGGVGGVGL